MQKKYHAAPASGEAAISDAEEFRDCLTPEKTNENEGNKIQKEEKPKKELKKKKDYDSLKYNPTLSENLLNSENAEESKGYQ